MLSDRCQDVQADIVDVAEDVVVPEADDGPASGFEATRSGGVVRCIRFKCVLRTIEFDNQSMCGTSEIDDVASDGELPTESQSHQPVCTQRVPQLEFCIGKRLAHAFGIGASV